MIGREGAAGASGAARDAATTDPALEDLLRLAREAELGGRPKLRDALLTLVVADGRAGDAVVAERARRVLVARQPDHWFANAGTLGQILAHERVAPALEKLREIFPPVRVQRLLMGCEAQRGAFGGPRAAIEQVLEDLRLIPPRRRPPTASAEPSGSSDGVRALPFPDASTSGDGLAALYLSVLMAMAVLLEAVSRESAAGRDHRAA